MKNLTYSSMAAARLRANKRQYLSLVLGIFLSIFLVSTLTMGIYGIYLATLERRYDKVGYMDMVRLDDPDISEADLRARGLFDRMGHAYITGKVSGRNVAVGYYDETGIALMNLKPTAGRLPEAPGEIAVERSALEVLEAQWNLGDQVELAITPVSGTEETRRYTLVGFLPERSVFLEMKQSQNELNKFPSVVTSAQEPEFAVGRTGTYCLMELRKNVRLSTALNKVSDFPRYYASIYGLSTSGEQVRYLEMDFNRMDKDMFTMMTMLSVLVFSLVLCCGVGISGAMEGMLSKRREEIGVLRALGATRRNIRQMFGRENLLLALIVSPLAIAMSCLCVWALSRLFPQSLVFGFRLWLLLPIGVFGVAVVVLSGYLPLARASKLMPMSIMRDTAMLRRSKKIKFRKVFSPTKLISARQTRFNPTRQIGAALLVGLMLLCSGVFLGVAESYNRTAIADMPGFRIGNNGGGASWDKYITTFPQPSMSRQSISQIERLDHVKSLRIYRDMPVFLQMDKIPRYALLNVFYRPDLQGMLDDALFQEALALFPASSNMMKLQRKGEQQAYFQFLEDYNLEAQAVIASLDSVSPEALEDMSDYLDSGSIHLDAINAGREVVVVIPDVWSIDNGNVINYGDMKDDPRREDAVRIAWNDAFTAGMDLPILQLYGQGPGGDIIRSDADVTVGAVVTNGLDPDIGIPLFLLTILSTEQGIENMGLQMEGLSGVEIYLDGELSPEAEMVLERQITAITRRTPGHTVNNYGADARAQAQQQWQIMLLIVSITVLFFAVAVGMIVSSVTRRMNSEGRTIGMLRAVGANEKAILGCYSGQITASVLGGLGISGGIFLLYLGHYWASLHKWGLTLSTSSIKTFSLISVTIVMMALLCWFACRFFLRLRIREIVNKSIIDNIREL